MTSALCLKVPATYWHIEPGDGTRYEFLIAEVEPGKLRIAAVGGARFEGYAYAVDGMRRFAARYGDALTADDYQSAIRDSGALDDPLVEYAAEQAHSNCNRWTAVAALRCAVAHMGVDAKAPAMGTAGANQG